MGTITLASATNFYAGDVICTGIPASNYLVRKRLTASCYEVEKIEGLLALTIAIQSWYYKQRRQLMDLLHWG